jgi:hypothetical protein
LCPKTKTISSKLYVKNDGKGVSLLRKKLINNKGLADPIVPIVVVAIIVIAGIVGAILL